MMWEPRDTAGVTPHTCNANYIQNTASLCPALAPTSLTRGHLSDPRTMQCMEKKFFKIC